MTIAHRLFLTNVAPTFLCLRATPNSIGLAVVTVHSSVHLVWNKYRSS